MDKIEERWWADLFYKLHGDSSIGVIDNYEKPDIRIVGGPKTIGLEVTAVHNDTNQSKGSKGKETESIRRNFTENLIDRLLKKIEFKFALGITFSDGKKLKSDKHEMLLAQLENICLTKMETLLDKQHLVICPKRPYQYFTRTSAEAISTFLEFDDLPAGIEQIKVYRYDNMRYSYDIQGGGAILRTLTNDDIDPILRNKEKKLANYDGCSQYWLLITEGLDPSSSFSEINLEYPLQSGFDRIYMIRYFSNELIRFK